MKKRKQPRDINQLAHKLVDLTTQDEGNIPPPTKEQISLFMAELGRKGGKIGGKRRLETMTAKERKGIAKKAAQARWSKVSDGAKNHSQ
jgi:hypothetical protein